MRIIKQILYSIFIFFFSVKIASGQFEISGKVIDANSKFPVSGAVIIIYPGELKAATDDSGMFSIYNIKVEYITIRASMIGYKNSSVYKKLIAAETNFTIIYLPEMNIMTGEIEVYSTKIEHQLKYSIFPIALVSRKSIAGVNPVSVSEVLSTKPGLNLVRDGIWATDINIRGMSRDNIVVLINGNRIETANNLSARLSLVDMNTIERIEVIKGGTSSIYGSGGTGGVVSITTLSGKFEKKLSMTGVISGGYAAVNEMTNPGLSLYLNSENIYSNLYTIFRQASDVKIPSGVIPNSSFRDYGISLNTGLRFSKNNFLTLDLQFLNTPYAGIPGGYPLFPNTATVTYEPAERQLAALTYERKNINGLISYLSAKVFLQNIFRDVSVVPNSIVFIPKTATGPARKITNISIDPDGKHYSSGAIIQADFVTNNNNKLIGGIDLWSRKLETSRERTQKIEVLDSNNNVVSTSIVQTGDVPIPDSRYTSIGLFAQDQISIMKDKLFVDVSARVDGIYISNEESVSPLYVITNGVVNNSPPNQIVLWEASSSNDLSWSFNTGGNYKLSKELNCALNFSYAYRSPSLEERFQYIDLGNLVRIGNPLLDPETGYFISTSLKYWSDDLNLSLELYSNYLTDLVTEIQGMYEGRNALVKTNIGSARLAGFDAEWDYNFYGRFVFYGGASFVNGEDTKTGAALPQIPPLNGNIGFKYDLNNFFNFNFNTFIYADQNRVATGEIATTGYAVFNFYTGVNKLFLSGYDFGFDIGIENIFNNDYRNYLSTNRGSVTSEPGRNFFFKAKLAF
ncbi:MAG: TonB-dependent receptor [Ignavibacteriae bacterium]|nr:TonB-dependent receptor [Ignavibacteriota bacterium]